MARRSAGKQIARDLRRQARRLYGASGTSSKMATRPFSSRRFGCRITVWFSFWGVPRVVETEEANGWRARPGDIERLCSARTKVLILNNGANPTGALYTRDELTC